MINFYYLLPWISAILSFISCGILVYINKLAKKIYELDEQSKKFINERIDTLYDRIDRLQNMINKKDNNVK